VDDRRGKLPGDEAQPRVPVPSKCCQKTRDHRDQVRYRRYRSPCHRRGSRGSQRRQHCGSRHGHPVHPRRRSRDLRVRKPLRLQFNRSVFALHLNRTCGHPRAAGMLLRAPFYWRSTSSRVIMFHYYSIEPKPSKTVTLSVIE
jgi:hypothetical protein